MKGKVLYLYAFDVANEIDVSRIRDILESKPTKFEIDLSHTSPKDIPLYKPLSIELTSIGPTIGNASVETVINIYEVGVVSIKFSIEFEKSKLEELLPMHQPILSNGKSLDEIAYNLCSDICKSIEQAIIQPSQKIPEPEAYTIFCVTDLGEEKNVNNWVSEHRQEIAELLTENKPGTLSQQQTEEVLRVNFSYNKDDTTIIDWDAALLVDLGGYVNDTVYVLELANLQLEEYKIMDQNLDQYLNKAYDDLKDKHFKIFGPLQKVLRKLRTLRIDVTKLNDEVTHITKFFGDWYLARVYLGARERFHLDKWRNSVAERLTQLDAIYTVVQNEISNLRMLWLEVTIVVFFAIDLLAIFFFK